MDSLTDENTVEQLETLSEGLSLIEQELRLAALQMQSSVKLFAELVVNLDEGPEQRMHRTMH